MMELFITKDLFDQLLKSEFPEEELARREAERAYLIAQKYLWSGKTFSS